MEKRGERPRFLFAALFSTQVQVSCVGFMTRIPLSLLKALLVKAERDHKSFVDLSHYAAGQIADFVF